MKKKNKKFQKHKKALKILIAGARGIGKYGGFETVVSILGPELAKRGYEVYCSSEKGRENNPKEYDGVKIIYFPIKIPQNYTIRKFFEIIYDWYFLIKYASRMDIIYVLGIGGGPFQFFPRLFGKISVVNIDGLEWRRSKFNAIEKTILKFFYILACAGANHIIIDNNSLINYIPKIFQKKAIYIPYGVEEPKQLEWNEKKLEAILEKRKAKIRITPNNYWLVVARLEPENNIHTIIQGFLNSGSNKPLIIVGDFTSEKYRKKIHQLLKKDKDNKILMVGAIYDKELLFMLRQHCFGYIHGHSVGGTNPSLLEAMISKNLIIAHDNEFNREVGGDTIQYFNDINKLNRLIKEIENNPKCENKKQLVYHRVKSIYLWDNIISKYRELFEKTVFT